ncbi:MAG: PIN domain-containing protein [Pelotomaculum sp.]|uniref:Predicted nucleic acid-binding protein n=1 Tax=Pelotomaculum thermopropionicum (strain DSM 13744 / JCM 10971 / SI) TaxID=370438 RepID=A5CYI1_PELTS|nr:PIN domain-containing protein [Pelotomaculum sp.]BAF60964.1 predicted nucleic acid-binding protein [Pelotomaculum thermopropionicum SI]
MRKVFVDTGAWYALKDSRDPHHQEAIDFFTGMQGQVLCFTSDYVADEAITLVRYRLKNHRVASDLARELFAEKAAKMIFVSFRHHTRALEIFTAFSDQLFSYTDCTSFAIMETMGIEEALAFDSHFTFEKFGFRQIRGSLS